MPGVDKGLDEPENGATKSSENVNKPSRLTSRSTSPTKSLTMVKNAVQVKVPSRLTQTDILTKGPGLNLPQVVACVDGILSRRKRLKREIEREINAERKASSTQGTSVLKRGRVPGLSSRVTSALKRGVSQTWEQRPRAELDIDLNLESSESRNSDAGGESVADGSRPMRNVPLTRR